MPSPARNKHQRQRHHHHLGERGQRGPRRRRRGQRHRRRSLLLQHPHPPRHLHSFPTRRSSDLPGRLLWHLHFQPHHRGLELHPQSSPGRPAHRRTDRPRPPRRHILRRDRKSTRLNSSHVEKSYAVYCYKRKRGQRGPRRRRRGQRNRRRSQRLRLLLRPRRRHRHLHSFPTRRSSDLLWHLHFQPHHRGLELHPQSSPGRPAHRRTDRPRPPRRHILRSEEHTSELQPRKDLERRRHLEQNNERAQRGPRSGRRGQRNRRR